MISPHTPKGAKLSCVHNFDGKDPLLTVGAVYTLDAIEPLKPWIACNRCGNNKFHCSVVEVDASSCFPANFCLCQFRRLDLPKCLTDILEREPVDA